MLYFSEVLRSASATPINYINKLQILQAATLKVSLGCPKTTSTAAMEVELNIKTNKFIHQKQIYIKRTKIKTLLSNHLITNFTTNKMSFSQRISMLYWTRSHSTIWNRLDINTVVLWDWLCKGFQKHLS